MPDATDPPEPAMAAPEPSSPPVPPLAPAAALAALRGRLMAASDSLDACRPPKLWGDFTDTARIAAWRDRCAAARRKAGPQSPLPASVLLRGGGGFAPGLHPRAPSEG